MKSFLHILFSLGISSTAYSQFTVLPTGTTTAIWDIVKNDDTLVFSGWNNYFAKSFDMGTSIVPMPAPGLAGGYNFDLQVKSNKYYVVSGIGFPSYQYQILETSDWGNTWNILFDTSGAAFYTFSMVDTTWGAIAGSFGNYAYAVGNDDTWVMDTLYGSPTLYTLASGYWEDSTLIFLTVNGAAISTTNRGQSWYWGYGMNAVHEDVQFMNGDTVYSISHEANGSISYFSKSVNGGHNFSTITLTQNSGDTANYGSNFDTYARDLWFTDPMHGYIVGYNNDLNESVIFETNDYGQTWTVYHTGFSDAFYSLLYLNDSTAFIGGANGLLVKWNPSLPLAPVGIHDEYFDGDFVELFPNPADESIMLDYKGQEPVTITITDIVGNIVSQKEIIGSEQISVRDFPNGTYFLMISTNGRRTTKKIIVNH